MPPPWPEHLWLECLELAKAGVSRKVIAERVGRSKGAVDKKLQSMGFVPTRYLAGRTTDKGTTLHTKLTAQMWAALARRATERGSTAHNHVRYLIARDLGFPDGVLVRKPVQTLEEKKEAKRVRDRKYYAKRNEQRRAARALKRADRLSTLHPREIPSHSGDDRTEPSPLEGGSPASRRGPSVEG